MIDNYFTIIENERVEVGIVYPTLKEKNLIEIDGFVIAPNPNDGNFNIQFETQNAKQTTIEIYNSTGKLLFSQIIQEINIGKNLTPISLNIENQVVFIRVFNDNYMAIKRCLIK